MSLPYYLTRDSLIEHMLIRGASGSGKTALILAPLLEQIVRIAGKKRDSSLVVIDLKGDPALFSGLKYVTEQKAGLRFRWFTPKANRTSYVFNPCLQYHFSQHMSVNQNAETLIKAFGLDHGADYGKSYFRDISLLLMRMLFRADGISSFAQLHHMITSNHPGIAHDAQLKKDARHLATKIDELASLFPLNATAETASPEVMKNAIDVNTLFDEPQVIYFYLPNTEQDILCTTVAKLAANLILSAAASRDNQKSNRVFVCIDEFQRIVGEDVLIFLQQARSMNVACMLANQTTADLDIRGPAIRETIEESTNVKIDLSANSISQVERLMKESPQVAFYASSFGESSSKDGTTFSFGQTERVDHMRGPNEMASFSDRLQTGYVRLRSSDGLTQTGGMQVSFSPVFHISKAEYEARQTTPWPGVTENPGTVLNEVTRPEHTKAKERKKPKARPKKPKSRPKQKAPEEKPSQKRSSFDERAEQVFRDEVPE